MLEGQVPDTQLTDPESLIAEDIHLGLEDSLLTILVHAYRKMYAGGRYSIRWKENKFNAVLKNYLRKQCLEHSRLTGQRWYVVREYYKDDEAVLYGDGDADAVPRIDIAIVTWENNEGEEILFPFECKQLSEQSSTLIKRYIERGLIDRYLNPEKDYSSGSNWGGMIGYILKGHHASIVAKLNEQIDKQLNCQTAHLQAHQHVSHFDAIYKSQHERLSHPDPITITHLFLPFQARIDNDTQN